MANIVLHIYIFRIGPYIRVQCLVGWFLLLLSYILIAAGRSEEETSRFRGGSGENIAVSVSAATC